MLATEEFRVLLINKVMLPEDGVQFVAKHCEVVKLDVWDLEIFFFLYYSEYVFKGKRAWQNWFVEWVFKAFDCTHELSVSDEVIFVEVNWNKLQTFLCTRYWLLWVLLYFFLRVFFLSLLLLLLEILMLYHPHDEMEILLGLLVCNLIDQYLRLKLYPRALSRKDSLHSLQHL